MSRTQQKMANELNKQGIPKETEIIKKPLTNKTIKQANLADQKPNADIIRFFYAFYSDSSKFDDKPTEPIFIGDLLHMFQLLRKQDQSRKKTYKRPSIIDASRFKSAINEWHFPIKWELEKTN